MGGRQILLMAIAAACIGLDPVGAGAQPYATRPIKLIVPFPAGGPPDTIARLVADRMSSRLGQTVVIDNRPGGGATVGTRTAALAEPDGYTLLFASTTSLSIGPALFKNLDYDPVKSFAPVAAVSIGSMVVAVSATVPVKTLPELVAYAKANPRKISFGSAGIGTFTHMAVELLKIEAKIDVVHVPYRGAAPAVNDLLGGHIQMIVLDVPVLLPHIRAGSVRPLGVTSATRTDALPNVPTTGETGFKTVLSDNWYGLVAPAGMPADVEDKLRKAALATLRSAELKKHFDTQDAVPSPTTPEEFASFVKSERAKWEPVVTSLGIKLD